MYVSYIFALASNSYKILSDTGDISGPCLVSVDRSDASKISLLGVSLHAEVS